MENYNNIELLAPAGDLQTLQCAIENGADAVYIGGKSFNARKNAKNFTDDEIMLAVRYAHLRGAKVYVTLNTLIHNDELELAFNFIKFCYEIGVDALIVQDLAIVSICSEYFPDFEIHSSTQMTIASVNGAKMMEELGFSRIVLAREMSYDEIKAVSDNTKLELEVFVHGALCVCYSGQCLFSSIVGSRSGNRGDCAQPCRLPYMLYDYNGNKAFKNPKYVLSLKDYNLIDNLDKLKNIGIKSLKIEGRMKSKEYVSIVSSVYKKKLNNSPLTEFDYFKLENIFNRSGFTTNYFDGRIGRDMINSESNNDYIYRDISDDVKLDAQKLSEIKTKFKKVSFNIKISNKMKCTVFCDDIEFELYPDVDIQVAKNLPISSQRVIEQFEKLGNTSFICDKINVSIEGNYFISVADLNNARRECIKNLEMRILSHNRRYGGKSFEYKKQNSIYNPHKKINIEVTTFSQAQHILTKKFENVFIPYEVIDKNREYFSKFNNIVCVLPQTDCKSNYNLNGIKRISISNIGQIYGNEDKELYSQPSLNVLNTLSANMYKKLGVSHIALSYEINIKQIENIDEDDLEIVVYGKIPVMNTRCCLHKSFLGGCKCNENDFFALTDRKNKKFYVKTHPFNCTNTIYNCEPIYMADKLNMLNDLPVSSYRMVFTTENNEEIDKIIELYKKNAKPDFSFTRGHYFRGV